MSALSATATLSGIEQQRGMRGQNLRETLACSVEPIMPLLALHRARSPARQTSLVRIAGRAPRIAVKPSQDTNHGLGLVAGAPLKHIALFSRSDVLEHEYSTPGLIVGHATEEIRDAATHELSAVTAEQQFALDRDRTFLLDDDGERSAALSLDRDSMNPPAQAVLSADLDRARDLNRAESPLSRATQCPAQERRSEDTIAGRDIHDLSLTEPGL